MPPGSMTGPTATSVGTLDGALLQMIEDLIAGHAAGPRYLPCLFEIRHIEIACAIGKNLALAAKCFESRNRFLQWVDATRQCSK